MSMKEGRRYADVEYPLLQEDGTSRIEKGLYLIADGGYHRWRVSASAGLSNFRRVKQCFQGRLVFYLFGWPKTKWHLEWVLFLGL
jgi:hypothetical protein